MPATDSPSTVGLLLSGGLDSGILLGHLLGRGSRVQPLYVRAGLHWEGAELRALEAFLAAMQSDRLAPLATLAMPLADVYGAHWSITGRGVPDADTTDDAVFLPGRNAILLVEAAVWCGLHEIEELALAVLGSNPFRDASVEFFDHLQTALDHALGGRVRIVRPFGELTKREVMQLGRDLPLELTFSCIDPREGLHCGRCNKCAERREAFRSIGMEDPTRYYQSPLTAFKMMNAE
ncbi:MAG: 7-cyano-7-deazaguanine synthase [Pirellulales bacterium]|nr:7-cyano-7-deazaguanine synthase [Pirellulales bacterium]